MNPYTAGRKLRSWDKRCLCVTKDIQLLLEASKYQGDINHYYVQVQDVYVSLPLDRLQGPSSWKERRTKNILCYLCLLLINDGLFLSIESPKGLQCSSEIMVCL